MYLLEEARGTALPEVNLVSAEDYVTLSCPLSLKLAPCDDEEFIYLVVLLCMPVLVTIPMSLKQYVS